MPVRRFRDVSEIPPPWREPGSRELMRAIAEVWAFAERTNPRRFPPGVYRHRSIEAAKALKETWAAADFQALADRRPEIAAELSRRTSARPEPTE